MKNCLVIMAFRDSSYIRQNQLEIEKIIDVCYLRCFKEIYRISTMAINIY